MLKEIMVLSENIILITGGSSGIGFELASRLSKLGNTVIITGRNLAKLEQVKLQFNKLHIIQSDVSNPDDILKLYETIVKDFPGLNIIINNAGIMRNLNLHDESINLQDINREIVTNLSGPVRMVQQFLPLLKTQPSAAIINVSSGLAFVHFPISPVYSATKAGLHAYTQALRVQLKNTRIKVFEIAPPGTDTPLQDNFVGSAETGPMMKVDKLVDVILKGLQNDKKEIRPGLANLLKIISRVAPQFALKMLSKPVDQMLSNQ
ncbi:SDR family NAD(P)-dependent oxidoreductase [Mucilaginibacter sp. KACC 22773]|uniref:SDR family oxidoreductase n=1 Tax=Mucilaginibacter sp. KACC 22773 TaxID=3025671 RepID=UPI00236646E9|nr:SDR family NAD(P)-dependent oxidoreductase [Mucilaginibacter sp. KACC 22773]WDF81143.1 SDR family NAD(P)-dependent oxidoreductase [Mucilaginibacter sp. KACC 22773]